MDRKILAIGGAVIKTSKEELRKVIENDKVEMLIHNGGSIFHDFQQVTDDNLESHSYPIDDLLEDYSCNERASKLVWSWIKGMRAPENSITDLCFKKNIDVFLFTGSGCDFWQLYGDRKDWGILGETSYINYKSLVHRFKTKPFHYICMGSAVIHPEVFIKAIADAKPKEFISDVVDFKDMYRPRTRVAKFGSYYKMTHKEYLNIWNKMNTKESKPPCVGMIIDKSKANITLSNSSLRPSDYYSKGLHKINRSRSRKRS